MSNIRTEYYNTPKEVDTIKSKWWEQEKSNIYASVMGVVGSIEEKQSYRQVQNVKYARLYSNMELLGFYGTLFSRTSTPLTNNRVTLNVIKACVDTAASKIAKNKPRPMFLTSGGNYKQQRKAKKLTKYIDGAFDVARVYETAQKIFVDGAVMGTGILKVYKDYSDKTVRP